MIILIMVTSILCNKHLLTNRCYFVLRIIRGVADLHHFDADLDTCFHFSVDSRIPPVTLMWIQVPLFALMWVRIPPFTLGWIRISPFTLMWIRIRLSTLIPIRILAQVMRMCVHLRIIPAPFLSLYVSVHGHAWLHFFDAVPELEFLNS
jgi:hypothetical protein